MTTLLLHMNTNAQVALDASPRWSGSHIFDIVRGMFVFKSMAGIKECVAYIAKSEDIEIVRVKNRFSNPTDGGWMVRLLAAICSGLELHDRAAHTHDVSCCF